MSVEIDIKTPNKQNLSAVLRAIADLIETSRNTTVSVLLTVKFQGDQGEAQKDEA